MTEVEESIINEKQVQLDLLEQGVIRSSGHLISELNSAVEDDRLTTDSLRKTTEQIVAQLKILDRAKNDINDLIESFRLRAKEALEVGNA